MNICSLRMDRFMQLERTWAPDIRHRGVWAEQYIVLWGRQLWSPSDTSFFEHSPSPEARDPVGSFTTHPPSGGGGRAQNFFIQLRPLGRSCWAKLGRSKSEHLFI